MNTKILPLVMMILTGSIVFAQKDSTATSLKDSSTINPNKKA